MNGNGNFGNWIVDECGLPAYNYTCNQFIEEIAKYKTTYGFSIDHFHQIGNDRITATAHNGGYIQVLEASRGFQWLTYHSQKKRKFGGGLALFQLNNETWSDLFAADSIEKFHYQRIFGLGYFQKIFVKNNVKIIHTICAPFSDDPIFISEIEVKNESDTISMQDLKIIDFWDIYLHHILKSLIVTANNRKVFGKSKFLNLIGNVIKLAQKITRTDTESSRNRFDKKFDFNSQFFPEKKTLIITPKYKKSPNIEPSQPAKHNFYPSSLFLSMLEGTITSVLYKHSDIYRNNELSINLEKKENSNKNQKEEHVQNPCLALGTKINLIPKQSKKIICAFGYAPIETINSLISKYKTILSETSIIKWNADKWEKTAIKFKCEKESWLARETLWHSYYVRSACFLDEYSNLHKFPQGSIYLFGHGLDGAIRDYMLFLNAIIFIDPKLAKEYLSYAISFMEPNGKLPYSIYGFAQTFTKSVHSKPSDLYIFLIWGILEYTYLTRDFDFLQQKIPFYPKSLKKESTILEKLYVSLEYLFSDKVGVGEHGLIKCNDGDWSDGISLMVKNRKKFIQFGESNFNTAFIIYVLQKLIPLLKEYNLEFANQCSEKLIRLKQAILQSWNGKWFYRGWDGQGNPIGDKSIYLEHHNWILISKILEKERAQALINEMYKNLDAPSPIGQYISYPPEKTTINILPPGWDVNGGVWHAMNSLLTWAYSLYDIEKAYKSLIKNSLTQRADAYPNIWYGIWTGPDAYIANYAENDGQAFYHLLTPMCDFPAMNLNVHACYLLSVIKMAGIEAYYDAIEIVPKFKDQNFEFNSPLIKIISKENQMLIDFCPKTNEKLVLRIKKPNWWNSDSIVLVNNIEYNTDDDRQLVLDDKIIITINENLEKINIILKSK